MVRQGADFSLDMRHLDEETLLLKTDRGLGNGRIDDIRDIIFSDPAAFDRGRTESMPGELEYFNKKLGIGKTAFHSDRPRSLGYP